MQANLKRHMESLLLWLVASAVLLSIVMIWQAATLVQVAGMMCEGGGIYITFNPWLVVVYVLVFVVVLALVVLAWRRSNQQGSVRAKRFTIIALLLVMASWLVAGLSLLAAVNCI